MEGVGITEMQYWPRQAPAAPAPPPARKEQTAVQGSRQQEQAGSRTRKDRREQPAVVEKDRISITGETESWKREEETGKQEYYCEATG